MRRRRFLAAVGGAAFAGPIAAVAQQSAGIPRVGLLMGADPSDEAAKLGAFRGALERLGYVDGQTILIELRYAMGEPDRFGSLAGEPGNVTGFSNIVSQLNPKRLELLSELVPQAGLIALLVNPSNANTERIIRDLETRRA